MDEVEFDLDKYAITEKGNNVRFQLWIIVIIGALFLGGFIIYRNLVWIRTGKMEETVKISKKNKKNKGYWNAGDVG